MTRSTLRVIDSIRSARIRELRGLLRSRKALVGLGAGLALAGAGAATASAGFGASTATAAGENKVASAMPKVAAGQHRPQSVGQGKHAAHRAEHRAEHRAGHRAGHVKTWGEIRRIIANETFPKAGNAISAADRLKPVGTSGPQEWMPITTARWDNAKTIVKQALAKHMGLRSAVIAVATSMQESTLKNISYGDRDSVGLFQQRPSYGWGTPAQILHPAYAADAFLNALRTYQAKNPGWAHQPLWEPAQGVQQSGFPYAYAKWEAQAAHLVGQLASQMV